MMKLILAFMIWQIYFWLFFSSTLILISSFMMFLFFSSMFLYLTSKNQWCTILFVIFLLGGLMVSFFYMVSINSNNFKLLNFNFYFIFFFMMVFYLFFSFKINFFYQNFLNVKIDSVDYNWKEKQIIYMLFVVFILFYLIVIMIFVDKKLKICKNSMKEFN